MDAEETISEASHRVILFLVYTPTDQCFSQSSAALPKLVILTLWTCFLEDPHSTYRTVRVYCRINMF